MIPFKAIAAMAENRAIGLNNQLPWHLPEDFRFFKQQTMGHRLLMGRKTFDSIGRPLPGRESVVLSRTPREIPGVRVITDIEQLNNFPTDKDTYVLGGAEIYQLTLPYITELYLTHVKRVVEGDAFFPPMEMLFTQKKTLLERPEFTLIHYSGRHDLPV
jgi:dihydrofolate reductase